MHMTFQKGLLDSHVCRDIVEVKLRPTVSRPVRLGVRRPSGTRDQFFFLLEISFRQLRVCYFVAPSLMRGLVRNVLYNCFWALPEHSCFEVPQNLRPYFTVSFETPPTWRVRSPYLYLPGTEWPSYTPGHWVNIVDIEAVPINMHHLEALSSPLQSSCYAAQAHWIHITFFFFADTIWAMEILPFFTRKHTFPFFLLNLI
jgi:hypothetical protein